MTKELAVPAATLDLLRDQLAPEASDLELAYFGQVAQRLDLDPFKGEICLVGRKQNINGVWKKIHKPQIEVAGRRVLAARTGQLQGIEGPVWCGPRENGELVWREIWDDDDRYPYAARVLVYRAGWVKPGNGTCKWSEFAVYMDNERTKLGPMWQKMPSHMLGKVAESLALRRAFPDVIPTGNISEEFVDLDRTVEDPTPALPAAKAAVRPTSGVISKEELERQRQEAIALSRRPYKDGEP